MKIFTGRGKALLPFIACICIVWGMHAQNSTIYVSGSNIYAPNGERVIFRGVNKMIFYNDRDGVPSYSEIAKTGANAVRIFWFTSGTAAELDQTLANAVAQRMIAIPALWEATGKWGADFQTCVNYWSRPDIVEVIERYKRYVIVNIANEAGDGSQSQTDFRNTYQAAVNTIRNAGVTVPLMIDAAGWGRNEEYIFSNATYLQGQDPQHKLIFSWHPWDANAPASRIQSAYDRSISNAIPFIVGEYAHKSVGCACCIDYHYIISYAQQRGIGWLAWEWGPGNSDCSEMDMTTDSNYNTLRSWGLEVAVTDPNSIQNTSVRPNIFTGDAQAPSVPSGLASSNITNTSFTLSWSAATDNIGVVGYEVFRNGISVGTPSGTSLSITTGLVPGTTYSMTVRARDAAGNWSAQSAGFNVTTTGTAPTNLALTRPVVASATESGFPASNANDGNTTTRWSTPFSDPQWIYVDLGTSRSVNRVVLRWEAAFASGYQIQTSDNASSWTTIYSTTTGDGGADDITLTGTGRYIRMNGTVRGTTWGYSLFEFEVYGSTGGDTQAPSVPAGLASSAITQTSFTLSWSASSDNIGVTGYEVFRNGTSIGTPSTTSINVTGLTAATTYAMTVRARDAAGNWSAQSNALNVTTQSGQTTTKYEAENATLTGTTVSNTGTGFSGTGFVNGLDAVNDKITFNVNISTAGSYPLVIRYQNSCGVCEKYQDIKINSAANVYTQFLPTATGWSDKNYGNVTLNAGNNTIEIIRSWGYTDIDYITVGAGGGGDTSAPSVPTGLASSSITQTSFTLAWTASTDNVGVTGYEVFRNGTSIGTPSTNSFNVTGLTAATTYSMTVRSRDAAGNWSAQSSALNVTTSSSSSSTVTLNPVADTDTQSDNASGTNPTLNASLYNFIFLKFNLSSISGAVTSAKVRIYRGASGAATLNVSNASPDSWTEGGTDPTLGTLIGSTSMGTAAGYYEVDVTSRVVAEAAGDDLITFGITTNLSSWQGFNSRENASNKPQLVVTSGGSGGRVRTIGEPEAIEETVGDKSITIFPNPLKSDILNITIYSESESLAAVTLLTPSSQTISQKGILLQKGNNTVQLDVTNGANGMYFVEIVKGADRIVKKVIIQK